MVVDHNSDDGVSVPLLDSSPSEKVVQAVADAEGLEPTELPPLYEVVDPEALDSIFQNRASGSIMFEYHGYTVTVQQNDVVTVQE